MYRKIICQDELQRVIHKGRRNVLLGGVAGLRERNRVVNWGGWWHQPRGGVEADEEIHHRVCVCGHGCDFCREHRSRLLGGRYIQSLEVQELCCATGRR